MKIILAHNLPASAFTILAAGLLLGTAAEAAIIVGINSVTSDAKFDFDDTNSLNTSSNLPGVTLISTIQVPWAGNPLGLTLIDPVTTDKAVFAVTAYGWNSPTTIFGVALQNVTLTQAPTSSGNAGSTLETNVRYFNDGNPLVNAPLIIQQFSVSGTVQTAASMTFFQGFVEYHSLASGLIERVNYGYANNTPGPFTGNALAVPVNNVTSFSLAPNDALIVSSFFTFSVDPASITVNSVPEAVPEPGVSVLGLLSLPLLWRRRRA